MAVNTYRRMNSMLARRHVPLVHLAYSMHMKPKTLVQKLQGQGRPLTIWEIEAIVKTLNLTPNEAEFIFFAE